MLSRPRFSSYLRNSNAPLHPYPYCLAETIYNPDLSRHFFLLLRCFLLLNIRLLLIAALPLPFLACFFLILTAFCTRQISAGEQGRNGEPLMDTALTMDIYATSLSDLPVIASEFHTAGITHIPMHKAGAMRFISARITVGTDSVSDILNLMDCWIERGKFVYVHLYAFQGKGSVVKLNGVSDEMRRVLLLKSKEIVVASQEETTTSLQAECNLLRMARRLKSRRKIK